MRPLPLLAIAGGCWLFSAASTGSARSIDPAPVGQIESGIPSYSVDSPESMGLSSPPHDLKRLPDGRIAAFARDEIALGDGARWEVYRLRNIAPGTPVVARQFAVAPDGTLYTAVRGGLARVEFGNDRTWSLHQVAELPAPWNQEDRTCSSVVNTEWEWIWHSGSGPLFSWRPGESVRLLGTVNAVESVFALEGRLYVSDQSNGITYRVDNTGLVPEDFGLDGYVERSLTAALPLQIGAFALATSQKGLWRQTNGKLTPFSTAEFTQGTYRIEDLALVDERFLAVAIEGVGLAFFTLDGQLLQVLDRAIDHRLASARKILVAPNRTVWVLLNDAVAQVGFPHPVSHFEPLIPTSLRFPRPYRHHGRLWLTNNGQSHRGVYDRNQRLLHFELDSPASFITSMVELEGDLFATTEEGIFRREKDQRWNLVVAGPKSPHINPQAVSEGRWFYAAENETGWLFREGNGFRVERHPMPGLGHVYDGDDEQAGEFWLELGTGKVGRADIRSGEPKVEIYDTSRGVGSQWAQLFFFEGRPLINLEGALVRFDAEKNRFLPELDLPRRLPALALAHGRPKQDASGHTWVASPGGVLRLAPKESGADSVRLSTSALVPNHIVTETDGTVWFVAQKGLARFDPRLPLPALPRPALLVTRVDFADGTSTTKPPGNSLGEFAAGASTFTVNYLCPSAPFGHLVTFEAFLSGVDGGWKSVGGSGSVTYHRLGAGDYQLQLRARYDDVVGPVTSLSFRVLPHWYLSRWAMVGYALSLGALVYAVFRIPQAMARREKARLEAQVQERTLALHESNLELAKKIEEVVEQNEKRRQLEAQMYQIQRVESIGTLAGGVAHDFNNVLTGMLGYAELAALEIPSESPAQGHLKEITHNGLRAKDLIARILMYSRKGESQLQPLNLAEPVREALRLLQTSSPSHVKFQADLSPVTVLADATQIHQVVLNLGTNALHAMGEKAGLLQVRLTRKEVPQPNDTAQRTEMACLEVEDNGIGMRPETVARIFEPFFTTKEPGRGTGLGLSSVQGIVANHHGSIRVESEWGRGTRFEILLPLTTAMTTSRGSPEMPAVTARNSTTSSLILVVDDEPAVARSTSALLEHTGYRVKTFTDPVEALAFAKQNLGTIGALITDLSMPQMTGVELSNQITYLKPALPVLLISGYAHPHRGEGPLAGPHVRLLTKPYLMRELLAAVSGLFGPTPPGGRSGPGVSNL